MKRQISTCLLLLATMAANAQNDYAPMLKEGRMWTSLYDNGNGYRSIWEMWVAGDSLVDGEQCYKILNRLRDRKTGEVVSYNPNTYSVLQEKDGCVWDRSNGEKQLLYDFTLSVGDRPQQYDHLVVVEADSVEVDGCRRLCLMLHNTDTTHDTTNNPSNDYQYWVEGIGGFHGSLMHNENNYHIQLQSCTDGDKLLFRGCDFARHIPLLSDGKEWVFGRYRGFNQISTYRYFLDGDTIISGERYHRLYQDSRDSYRGALREEGLRVYFVDKESVSEQLLYDFGITNGDAISVLGKQAVLGRTGVMYGRGCFVFGNELNDEHLCFWLDGVGCMGGLLSPLCDDPQDSSDHVYSELLRCTDGDTVLYETGSYNSIATTATTTPYRGHQLFDLQGRRVNGQSRPGIYISADGKRKVMKK